ncbi:zinc finger protein 436-like [Culicoides brevitarsis]|uniref:zinc finger protein 436-like n=1 Tax=Culicoides brevitarsis TaxID=469753 RepID=UPI00307BCC5F
MSEGSNRTFAMSKDVMEQKLKHSCRLCMNERRAQVSLFETTSKRAALSNAEIVQLFTDIEPQIDDGLPETICTKCENMLHLILDFKVECQESNETLMAIYEFLHPKKLPKTALEEVEEQKNEKNPEVEAQNESLEEQEMSIEALEGTEINEEDEMKEENPESDLEFDENLMLTEDNDDFDVDSGQKTPDLIVVSVVDESELRKTSKKGPRKKTAKCEICGKLVEGPAKLSRHMRVHDREDKKASQPQKVQKPSTPATIFSCNVCHKEFSLASRLKKHLETHLPMSMREKSYVCHCGKRYLDSGALKSHQTIVHSDNVPSYACEICGKEFTRKNYRDYHQRIHTSDKPHACELCDFRSAKRHNLVRHMLVHNNEFKFKCEACGKKFKRKTGLIAHQSTHGCNRSFMCPHCGRGYPSRHHLQNHLQKVHEIKLTDEEFENFMIESDTEVTDEQVETDDMNLIYAIQEITNDG